MQIGVKNEATNAYRDLVARVCTDIIDGTLESTIDTLPEKLYPDGSSPRYYDTLEAERAVCRKTLYSVLGHVVDTANPPTQPLSEALRQTQARNPKDYVSQVSVIPEGCHKCNYSKYYVTDACEGCVARPCITNCPKKCITRVDGKARIDASKCIGCGMCEKNCPYNAILKRKIPCVDDCPVDAISKDAEGRSIIDPAKCIHCGKCMVRCPFGTIVMPSQIVDVVTKIKAGKQVIACLAPAVLAQYTGTPAQIHHACLKAGFSEMVEVAVGADTTSINECQEYLEHVGTGHQPVMATSCCPAWVRAVRVHVPGLAPYISSTASPMVYTANLMKKKYPDCVTVFVGPCNAKRTEALGIPDQDHVLTSEELLCLFTAHKIDVMKMPKDDPSKTRLPSLESTNYCITQAVTEAVVHAVPKAVDRIKAHGHTAEQKVELKPVFISPLDKKSFKQVQGWGQKLPTIPGNLIECMCCDGGCIAGPGNVVAPTIGATRIKKLLSERPKYQDIEDVTSL